MKRVTEHIKNLLQFIYWRRGYWSALDQYGADQLTTRFMRRKMNYYREKAQIQESSTQSI